MEPETPPEPSPRRDRIRSRTRILIAVAAVVGVVGGTAVGYSVQADRPPTPLPALAQTGLAYPAKSLPRGQEPEPLAAKDDRRVRTDGDLRKLLVAKPAGARAARGVGSGDGWLDASDLAGEHMFSSNTFVWIVGLDIRRIAHTEWKQGEYRATSVKLVQFRPGLKLGAVKYAATEVADLPDGDESDGEPLKGSGNGRYAVIEPTGVKAGYLPTYEARAVFRRGDVIALISISDIKRISKSDIRSLAERQLGRL